MTRFPFGDEIIDLQSHSKAIKKIRVTFDDSYVFTVGEDGLLIIYEIKDKVTYWYFIHLKYKHLSKEGKLKRDKEGVGIHFSEEFLISKQKYKKKIKKIEDL